MKCLFFSFIGETAFPVCISLTYPFLFHLMLMGKKGKSYDSVWIIEFLKNLKPEIKVLAVRLESKELTKHSY